MKRIIRIILLIIAIVCVLLGGYCVVSSLALDTSSGLGGYAFLMEGITYIAIGLIIALLRYLVSK